MINKPVMIVHNVRLGLATNSSSSHSLIFLSKEKYRNTKDNIDGFEFGWDHFTAATADAKKNYLAVMLNDTLKAYKVDDDTRHSIVSEWVGRFPYSPGNFFEEGYIDHQSMLFIPRAYGTNLPDKELFQELQSLFMQDGVVIGGGNDNEEDQHPLVEEGNPAIRINRMVIAEDYHLVAKKDEIYGFWTVFNNRSGGKVRFSMQKPATTVNEEYYVEYMKANINIARASTPDLADVKITDFCSENCEYCYMNSTVNGKHADYKDISNILKALANMKVFEIAIGGGAPVSHPDFIKVLKRARKLGIVPNFTTRSIAWVDKPIAKEIMEYAGAFAVSIDNHKKVFQLAKLLKKADIRVDKVNLHVVMGTITREEFRKILVVASRQGLRVTLLGYKDIGRGSNFEKLDYSWWLEDLKLLQEMDRSAPKFKVRKRKLYIGETQGYFPTISIDTVMAHDYQKELLDSGIPSWMFHTVDGAFSTYIDCVNNTMGPSSYSDFSKMQSFSPSSKTLGKDFRSIYRSFDIQDSKEKYNVKQSEN